ncbi:MAG TPA: RNA polymerase sigma factor [Solirubrobacteraceae bacterium]|jgi:RNA polymerase sigma-70 factor (ECF subfamily)|nr:RNA polymerase sigma factor [Solirubrobacteraceae bacterium]
MMRRSNPSARSKSFPSDFDAFYVEHAERLLVYFTRRTFDVDVASDLTAETFATALRCRHQFRGRSGEEAGGWLYAIARHQLGHFARRGDAEQRAVQRLGITVPVIGPEDHARIVELAGLAELRGAVAHQFGLLTDDQQAAVRLRVLDELEYDEVAQRLRISEATARARVSRGLRELATALESLGPGTMKEAT